MNICEGQGKFVIEAIPDEILEEGEKKWQQASHWLKAIHVIYKKVALSLIHRLIRGQKCRPQFQNQQNQQNQINLFMIMEAFKSGTTYPFLLPYV